MSTYLKSGMNKQHKQEPPVPPELENDHTTIRDVQWHRGGYFMVCNAHLLCGATVEHDSQMMSIEVQVYACLFGFLSL